MKIVQAFDLFCGIGGMTAGLRMAEVQGRGIQVVGAYDDYRYGTTFYGRNNRVAAMQGALNKQKRDAIKEAFVGDDVIKVLSARVRVAHAEKCHEAILQLADDIDPDFLIIEGDIIPETGDGNYDHENWSVSTHLKIEDALSRYEWAGVNECYHHYGIPHNKMGSFAIGSKHGECTIPCWDEDGHTWDYKEFQTLRGVIEYLPIIQASGQHGSDRRHHAHALPNNDADVKRILEGINSPPSKDNPFSRLSWDQSMPELEASHFYLDGVKSFIACPCPSQNRALSLREGLRIQKFPAGHNLSDALYDNASMYEEEFYKAAQGIAEATPPPIAQMLGESVLTFLLQEGFIDPYSDGLE